jgi:serine/threonine protein kinase
MANAASQSTSARYRVVRELGQRAQHSYAVTCEDGTVAVLHRFARMALPSETAFELVAAEEMAVLARDASCLKKNWHPNIARVRKVDLAGDVLDLTTELVDGVTLEDLIGLAAARRHAGEPILSHAVAARIFLDVLSGLAALHGLRDERNVSLGVFHGELCPKNVVIGKDGVARLVSVFRPRPVSQRSSSEALGYGAPEVVAGEGEQDGRVDIYAVGVMLWEALTERRLFDETTPARIAQRQREEEARRPSARLADAAMRALQFDPALRFRTAQEMSSAIRNLAGTVAQGSLVAQLVTDLAGERIRARRLALDPLAMNRSSSIPPLVSGSRIVASSPISHYPSAPPAALARESRVPPPAPTKPNIEIETAYTPQPLPARRGTGVPTPAPLPRLPAPLPRPNTPFLGTPIEPKYDEDDDDDVLPGPRQSMPDDGYLEQLVQDAIVDGDDDALPGPRGSHCMLDDYRFTGDGIDTDATPVVQAPLLAAAAFDTGPFLPVPPPEVRPPLPTPDLAPPVFVPTAVFARDLRRSSRLALVVAAAAFLFFAVSAVMLILAIK